MRVLLSLSLGLSLAVGLGVAGPTTAHATPNFPPEIQAYLRAKSKPPCRICHTTGDIGGLGTVNTLFGTNMRARGLSADDIPSLHAALDKMTAEKVDSSKGRGTPDVEVLKQGGDPNQVAPTFPLEDPVYGCGGDPGSGASFSGRASGAPLVALGVLSLVARRRRRLTRR